MKKQFSTRGDWFVWMFELTARIAPFGIDDLDLTEDGQHVLLYLMRQGRDTGQAWAFTRDIPKDTGVGRRRMREIIDELVDKGMAERGHYESPFPRRRGAETCSFNLPERWRWGAFRRGTTGKGGKPRSEQREATKWTTGTSSAHKSIR